MECNQIYNVKNGEGISGLSHGFCDECLKIEMEKVDELLMQESN